MSVGFSGPGGNGGSSGQPAGGGVSFAGLNRDELLRIRDDLNAALYDLDKRPMG